jgi:hypothetical protein
MDTSENTVMVFIGGTIENNFFGNILHGRLLEKTGGTFFGLPWGGIPHPRIFQKEFLQSIEDLLLACQTFMVMGYSQGTYKALRAGIKACLHGTAEKVVIVAVAGPLGGSPMAGLARWAKKLPWPFSEAVGGVVEMIDGSDQIQRTANLVRILMEAIAEDPTITMPDIVLIGGAHDHLVPARSAWQLSGCDEAHLYRVLVLGGNGPEPAGLPSNVYVLRTRRGMDDHLSMWLTPQLNRLIIQLRHKGPAEVLGSFAA